MSFFFFGGAVVYSATVNRVVLALLAYSLNEAFTSFFILSSPHRGNAFLVAAHLVEVVWGSE